MPTLESAAESVGPETKAAAKPQASADAAAKTQSAAGTPAAEKPAAGKPAAGPDQKGAESLTPVPPTVPEKPNDKAIESPPR